MKKLFENHPIFATCFTSCLIFLVFSAIIFTGLVFLVSKAVPAEDLAKTTNTENNYKYLSGNEESENKILSIPIKGIILTNQDYADPFGFFLSSQTIGYQVKSQLQQAAEDQTIKGVILEIDSPGGTITGAKAISDGVEYYRQKSGKPIIAHISGTGASGGYWVAAAADEILADTGSIQGSIGVIMGPFKQYTNVVSESGLGSSISAAEIDSFYISAGEDKTFGDPYTEMSEEARTSAQEDINNEYDVFVDYVSSRRQLSSEEVKDTIGARIYGNKKALELKLIDSIANRDEAFAKVASRANISDSYQIVTIGEKSFWEELLQAKLSQKPFMTKATCPLCGQMLYLHGTPNDYVIVPN